MKNVLVLCTGNSCRSQIAEGFLKDLLKGKAEVHSAGITTHGLNPNAVDTMNEIGIDISNQTSNNIEEYANIDFDYIITVCDHAKENCPYFPSNALRLHKNFKDPSKMEGSNEKIKEAFRIARDEIKAFSNDFAKEYF